MNNLLVGLCVECVDWICLDDMSEHRIGVILVFSIVGSVYYAPEHVHCES